MDHVGPIAGNLPDPARQALRLAESYVFGTEPGRIPAVLHEAYEASIDDRVRARLGATLARCWAYAGVHTRAVPFADAAVAHATATGDDVLLADALDAALTTHWGPDDLPMRTVLAGQLDDVTAHLTDVDARTQAHLWLLTVALELLDLPAMNRQMRALEVLGEDSPKALFFAASRRLTLDLLRGRVDTATELVAVASRAMERAGLADGWLVVSSMRGYAAVHTGDLTHRRGTGPGGRGLRRRRGRPRALRRGRLDLARCRSHRPGHRACGDIRRRDVGFAAS